MTGIDTGNETGADSKLKAAFDSEFIYSADRCKWLLVRRPMTEENQSHKNALISS